MSQFLLSIPEPCHESWEKMKSGEGGKFCEHCSKNVIDFSMMSDEQVLRVLQNNNDGLCGRFANQQLDRFIGAPRKTSPKNWLSVLTGLALMSQTEKANASNKTTLTHDFVSLEGQTSSLYKTANKQDLRSDTDNITISGNVVDDKGEGVAFATVRVMGTKEGVQCDAEGRFQLKTSLHVDTLRLEVAAIEYNTAFISVASLDKQTLQEVLKIVLTKRNIEVTVGAVVTVRKRK